MNMKRMGGFLKALRKEQGLTQEQLGEFLGVAGRTVSRWETGSNLPDLGLLVTLADFYHVDIRELIDGERKCEAMNQEMKDTLEKVADYAGEEKKRLAKRMCAMTAGTLLLFCAFLILRYTGLAENSRPLANLSDFALGLTTASLVLNTLYFSGILEKIHGMKQTFFGKKKPE